MNPRVRGPLLAALLCLSGFALLLLTAYEVSLASRLDATALNGLASLRDTAAGPIATTATRLADPVPVVCIVLGLVALGIACGRRRQAVAAAALVVAAVLTAETLKIVLAHPRYSGIAGHEVIGAAAFPSGHATVSIAVALAAVLVVPRRIRPVVAVAAAAYAIAVCISVIVLAWHFPSDVFGGMLVASFYFCLAVAVLRSDRGVGDAPGRLRASLRPPAWWREALAAAALVGVVAAAARAGPLANFASDHTAGTAVAVAVAVCAATLVAAAGLFADR